MISTGSWRCLVLLISTWLQEYVILSLVNWYHFVYQVPHCTTTTMVKSLQTGKCTQSEYSFRRRHITCMHVKKSTQSTWYFIPQHLQGLLEIRLPIAAPCQLLASHSNGSAWYPLCSRAWCSFSYSPHTAALMFCVSSYEYERNDVCERNRICF